MKSAMIVGVVLLMAVSAAQAGNGNGIPEIQYDYQTGLLVLELDGCSSLLGLQLTVNSGNIVYGTAANFSTPWVYQYISGKMQWAPDFLNGGLAEDSQSPILIGQLVTGLGASDFDRFWYVYESDHLPIDVFSNVTIVPEPSTFLFLACGAAALFPSAL